MGGSSMMKRFNLQSMVFIPYAGTTVQFGHIPHLISCRRGASLLQSLSQQISEEMVIAVPTPLVVQGNEEQVGVFDILEGFLSRKSTRLNSSHGLLSRMPSSA